MIVTGVIGLLAAIALPNFTRARSVSMVQACIANLKQIESATQIWLANGAGAAVANASIDMGVNLVPEYIKNVPRCPSGGTYTVTTEPPTCSLSGQADNPHLLP